MVALCQPWRKKGATGTSSHIEAGERIVQALPAVKPLALIVAASYSATPYRQTQGTYLKGTIGGRPLEPLCRQGLAPGGGRQRDVAQKDNVPNRLVQKGL